MTHTWRFGAWFAVGALLVSGACTDPFGEDDGGGGILPDGGVAVCSGAQVSGDDDKDGILNGDEGCLSGRDTDGDKTADWQDYDSDDDGIYDDIEKGTKAGDGTCASTKPPKNTWPCDTDGDGMADYLDVDSDSDGLLDKDEDANGDGLLGCCVTTCGVVGAKQKTQCVITSGCGPGQKCVAGKCSPAIAFTCSNGETDPRKKDTFGDGKLDNERGTFICRDATEDKPQGRKAVQLKKNQTGDWHVALETAAKYVDLKLISPGAKEAAAVIDHDASTTEVAGFVASRDTTKDKVQDEVNAILTTLTASPPGGSGTVSQRASGSQVKSHDLYDSVQGTILDLALTSASDTPTVRNELLATVLGKPKAQLGNLPAVYGSSSSKFIIRLMTLKRVEFKKDASGKLVKDSKGYPIDSGNKSKWRLIVMGSVAIKDNYENANRTTGFIVDDLANGTPLATYTDTVNNECDVGVISSLPIADIIWVIDESGSMDDDRANIVKNANNFFSRALSSGLDFRMGVTGVCNPSDTSSYSNCSAVIGKFCSQTNKSDDCDKGGTDRFLLPSEQTAFSDCVNDPPGCEWGSEYSLTNLKKSITNHLPRASGSQDKIRPDAKLVIIVATDESPEELKDASIVGESNKTCPLDTTTQGKLDTHIAPYLSLLQGAQDPEASASVHVLGGVCSNKSCSNVSGLPHGLTELAQQLGGQIGDICQNDLGSTLQVMIDSIVAGASPLKLDYVPISSSLAVAMDGVEIKRSRSNGFDYRSSANSLVFIAVKYKKGSEIIASYKRWEKQTDPDKP